ncbi:hypothetical protein G3A_21285 [Bacillus sp. 17376]|uniref:YQZC protein n=1 Tax=Mesobacillus boroniphilus JCM 21738 TaxID=1294265 RepID=W4RQ76_9BACI|nr:hypothetical protein [Mesobacillus boroniphilus]ESU30661.1 hypothetical protein G3A_21285 [Bacillus sp. 17376]GAE46028.1 yQZC protein [Mesobacillus boroniphilus JCM 21738]
MNKRTAQAFALGLIFAAIFLWAGSSVIAEKEPEMKVNVSDAKKILEEKGYKVLSSSEFAKLNEKKAEVVKEEKPKEEVPAEKVEEVKEEQKFTLIIASGMSPGDVATMLASQGIIDDESKFERFLIDQGYHTKVQIGKYELKSGLDYHQIAKIITKNR